MNKKITIEQLDEGYLITDQDDKRYAAVSLMPWLEKFFDYKESDQPKPETKKKS